MEAKKNGKGEYLRIGILDSLVVLFVAALFVYILFAKHIGGDNPLLDDLQASELGCKWYLVTEEGQRTEIELPYTCDADGNAVVAIEGTLPDYLEDNMCVSFREKRQNVKVYVGDSLRDEFLQTTEYIDTKRPVSRYMYVKLKREDTGKTIRIEGLRDSSGSRKFSRIWIGCRDSIVANYLQSQAGSIVAAATFAIIGVLSLIAGLGVRIATRNMTRIDYMGWVMILIAMWDMTQSDYRDMLFSNITLISLIPAFSLMLIPLPLSLYINWLQNNRYRKIYSIFTYAVIGELVVWATLIALRIASFNSAIISSFVFIYSLFALFVFTIVLDYKAGKKNREYQVIVYGMVATGVCGLVQMLRFFSPSESEDGAFLCLGFALLTFASFINAMIFVFRMNSEKKAALMMADMKLQFLANMSHEIRTPINAVLGMNEAILRESNQETVTGYASEVDAAGKLLLSLVNDILDFSKLESDKMKLSLGEYKVCDLISFCYGMVEKRARDRKLSLEVEVDQNVPVSLYGDDVRIKQIVINLLTNAVKYTERGFVKLSVDYEEIDTDSIMLKISVMDSGIGIKEEDQKKLFESFTRVDEGRNRNVEGTGLGLAITAKLINIMGGTIDVQSTYGSGSTFIVSIPQKIVSREGVGGVSTISFGSEKSVSVMENFTASGKRVLVTDDVDMNLKVINAFLKDSQMIIDNAASGDECIEMCRKNKYDVILLDHMMPGKDGIETFKEMRADSETLNKDTPVIMLTANALGDVKGEYLSKGFADYLSKPVSTNELFSSLKKILD